MAASCVSSTHVKRIERPRRSPIARQPMNNHLTGSGALGQDKGRAVDLCDWSWLGMAASCVSPTQVKRIERSRRLSTPRQPMNNHLAGSCALDQDEGHATDLCDPSWSGMAASCVSSTYVKRIEKLRRRKIARKGRLPIPKGRDYALKECGRVCHVFKSKKTIVATHTGWCCCI